MDEKIIKIIKDIQNDGYINQRVIDRSFSDDEKIRLVNTDNQFINSFVIHELADISLTTKSIQDKEDLLLKSENITRDDIRVLFSYEEIILLLKKDNSFLTSRFLNKCHKICFFSRNEAVSIINMEGIKKLCFCFPKLLTNLLYSLNQEDLYKLSESDTFVDFLRRDFLRMEELYTCFDNKIALRLLSHVNHSSFPDDEFFIKRVISLLNDEDIVYILDNYNQVDYYLLFQPSIIALMISSIKNDILRAKRIKLLAKDTFKEVMPYLFVDNSDIKNKKVSKREKIISIENDIEKEKAFNNNLSFLSNDDKGIIIASFVDYNYVLKYRYLLNNDKTIVSFLNVYHQKITDNKYNNYVEDNLLKELIFSLKGDNNKIIGLKYLDEEDGLELIDTIRFNFRMMKNGYFDIIMLHENYVLKVIKKLDCTGRKIFFNNIIDDFDLYAGKIDYRILNEIDDVSVIMRFLKPMDLNRPYTDDLESLFKKVSDFYGIDYQKLISLAKVTGCLILKHIKEDNVYQLLRLSNDDFDKYLSIFSNEFLVASEGAKNDYLESVMQKKFRFKHQDDINVFANTRNAIIMNNIDVAKNYISMVLDFLKGRFNVGVEELLKGLIDNNKEYIDLYHEMTNLYIALKRDAFCVKEREQYLSEFEISRYTRNAFANYIIEHLPVSEIMKNANYTNPLYTSYDLTKEEYALLHDSILLEKLLIYRKEHGKTKLSSKEKSQLHLVTNIINELFYFNCTASYIPGLPKELNYPRINLHVALDLICKIDVEQVKKTLLGDDNLLRQLIIYLKKTGLAGLIMDNNRIADDADIILDSDTIASLISFFAEINKDLNNNNVSVLDLVDFYVSLKEPAYLLFGKENYRFIRRDPFPNVSGLDKKQRLEIMISYFVKIRNRKTITVKPLRKEITLKNGKKVIASLGNFTNPIVFTLGERTGSCMRAGGVGFSFFDFCLFNPSGFHIVFEEPNTGYFIDRVSGFRNGNTIFLNELRNPVKANYSREDMVEALKVFSKELVNDSGSKYPIDNVVISPFFAMASESSNQVNLGVNNVTEGYSYFYHDIRNSAILLASSRKDNSLVPVKLDAKNLPQYPVGRDAIRCLYNEDAIEQAKCIEVRDLFLSGYALKDIDTNFNMDIVYLIYGEDWYISIDNNKKVNYYIMVNSINRRKAEAELNVALEEVYKNLEATYLKASSLVKKKTSD